MGVLEALVVFSCGLLCGVFATTFDVLFVGSASFVSHFSLWVLLNAVVATHLESRIKALWWSVAFNLGFVEAYYLTTAASYEGYSKSLVVPLAAMAIISPLLTNALWEAKRDKGAFGKFLSVLIVALTLVASYFVYGSVSVFAIVTSILVALLLLVVPVRRLSITPSKREGTDQAPVLEPNVNGTPREPTKRRGRGFSFGRKKANDAERGSTRRPEQAEAQDQSDYQTPRPTKRKGNGVASKVASSLPLRGRRKRDEEDRAVREREERLRDTSERRPRPTSESPYEQPQDDYLPTLGSVRVARSSFRSRRNDQD